MSVIRHRGSRGGRARGRARRQLLRRVLEPVGRDTHGRWVLQRTLAPGTGQGDASTRSRAASRPPRGRRKRALRQTCSREDPENAICVQRLDDSLNSAIRTRYRILLRSSSMHKPRDPPLEVVIGSIWPRTGGLSKHHTRLPWSDGKKDNGPRPSAETGSREACAMARAHQELGRAPQGRAGDRIPTLESALPPRARTRGSGGTVMILPQVHLRKPCYDFYFL